MRLGAYADGRPLHFDEESQSFLVGDVPVTAEQVRGYDAAGQVAWTSGELRDWFHARTSPPPAPSAPSPSDADGDVEVGVRRFFLGNPEQWEKTRRKGFPRFALVVGLPWGAAMFIATGLLQGAFADPLPVILMRAVIWLVAGLIFALVLWVLGERGYRRAKG